MVSPAVIEKEEPVKIYKVETLPEPELQFTSSAVVEFDEPEPDSYELVITGSAIEVIEPDLKPDIEPPTPPPAPVSSVYNDPFFNAYFKR